MTAAYWHKLLLECAYAYSAHAHEAQLHGCQLLICETTSDVQLRHQGDNACVDAARTQQTSKLNLLPMLASQRCHSRGWWQVYMYICVYMHGHCDGDTDGP